MASLNSKNVVLILIALIAAFKTVTILQLAHKSGLGRFPGPWYARYTHWVLKYHVLLGQRTPYIHSLHLKYGNYVRIAPNEISVSDLAAFRQIHKPGTPFTKSPWYQGNSDQISTEEHASFFEVMDNKRHAFLRKFMSPAFTPAAIASYEPLVAANVKIAVERLKTAATGGPVDMLKVWTFLTFDIITELAFGQSFGQLQQDEETELLRKINSYLILAGVNNELPIVWPMLTLLARFSAKIKELATVFHRVHVEYGQIAVQNTQKALDKKNPGGKPVIFATLLSTAGADDTKNPPNIDTVAKWASGLTVAGTDTSSVTLTYLIWSVLTHPEVKRKLLEEIAMCPSEMSFSELSKLTYMNNVMNETLRVWPVVPGSLYRMAPEAGYSFGEYEVPGFARVNTQAWTFHRNPEFFPDPDTFNPDRWLDPTPNMRDAFVPFGGGARNCIGKQFAQMELLHGAFAFFKACPDAVALSSKADMAPMDYFLMKPKAQRCLVTLKPSKG